MGQLKIPGLSLPAPNDPTRTADNFNALLRWSPSVSPRMLGVGTPLVGTNPPNPPSDAYVCQRGRVSVVFTAGNGTLTLPVAFPNGWLSLVLCGPGNFQYNPTGANLSSIAVIAGGSPTGTILVDIDAVGW